MGTVKSKTSAGCMFRTCPPPIFPGYLGPQQMDRNGRCLLTWPLGSPQWGVGLHPAQPSMECWHHHSQAGSCSQERHVYFLPSTRSRQAGTGRKPHRLFADSSWGTGLGWAGLGWAGLAARWVRPFQASSCWEKTCCSGGLGPSPGLDPLWLLACSPGHI